MPGLQVFQSQPRDIGGQIGMQFGSGLSQGFGQMLDRQRQQQVQGVLSKYFSGEPLTPQEERLVPMEARLKVAEMVNQANISRQKTFDKFGMLSSMFPGLFGETPQDQHNKNYQPSETPAEPITPENRQQTKSGYQEQISPEVARQMGIRQPAPQPQQREPSPSDKQDQARPAAIMSTLSPMQKIALALTYPAAANVIQRMDDVQLKKDLAKQKQEAAFDIESDRMEAKRVNDLATEIENEYKASINENQHIDRMEKLSESGTLSTPLMVKFLNALGLPLSILGNPGTEEYDKLEKDFVKNVSNYFPGQIRVYEIQAYMRTIPSLMNSPEGRAAIIRNMRLMNEVKEVRYNAYKDILKENKGKKPRNMGMLIEDRAKHRIAAIGKELQEGMEKATEKFMTPIPMIDPKGRAVNIPANQIENALKAGAKFR